MRARITEAVNGSSTGWSSVGDGGSDVARLLACSTAREG